MNRRQLEETITAQYGLSKADAHTAVEAVFTIVMQTVAAGEDVKLPRFGTFRRVAVSERVGRNMQTAEPVILPAHFTPRLRLGAEFVTAVREGNTTVKLRKAPKGMKPGGRS